MEDDKKSPLLRRLNSRRKPEPRALTRSRLNRIVPPLMIKGRAKQAGIENPGICDHSFRGTDVTAYLSNPAAKLEHAKTMTDRVDTKTRPSYDRRSERQALNKVERIKI